MVDTRTRPSSQPVAELPQTPAEVPAVLAGHVLKEAASVKLCFGTAFTAGEQLVEKAEEVGERFSTSLTILYQLLCV